MADRPDGDLDPAEVTATVPRALPEAARTRHTDGVVSGTDVRAPAVGVAP